MKSPQRMCVCVCECIRAGESESPVFQVFGIEHKWNTCTLGHLSIHNKCICIYVYNMCDHYERICSLSACVLCIFAGVEPMSTSDHTMYTIHKRNKLCMSHTPIHTHTLILSSI